MKPESRDWLEIAEQDIASARILLENGVSDNAAYFCQQAIEKLLKGLLTEAGVAFPRAHDLAELAELLGIQLSADQAVLLNRLTDLAARSRYPGAHYNERQVRELLAETEDIYQWLLQQLS